MPHEILGNKIVSLLVSFLYILIFLFGYMSFLHVYFEYAGFGVNESRIDNIPLLLWSIFISLLPVCFFSKRLVPSYLVASIIYFSLYIPIQLTYFLDFDGDILQLTFFQILYAIGMLLIVLSGVVRIKIVTFHIGIGNKVDFFYIILVLMLFSMAWIVWKYGGNFRLVSLEDVYTLRENNQLLGADVITSYISSWLKYFIIPVILSYGLFSKKKVFIILTLVSSLMIYMSTGAKSVLFQVLTIYLMFKFLKTNNLLYFFNLFGLGLSVILGVSLLTGFNIYSSIIWMRTIGNGGSLTLHYHYFFDTHPNTYFSHLNIVNLFTNSYPYGELSLGQIVGREYWSEKMNANANFWATDGLASMGGWGIVISSIILSIILIILNSVSQVYNKLFILLCTFPALMFILNSSLFSAFLSGGMVFLILMLSITSVRKNRYITN